MSDQDVVKHTKEPWVRRYSDRVTVPGDSDGSMSIAHCYSTMGHNCDANAARIVACVNACTGIPTADLPQLAALRELLDSCRAEIRCLYRQASGKDPSEATGGVRKILERINEAIGDR